MSAPASGLSGPNLSVRFLALSGQEETVCPTPQLRAFLDDSAPRGREQFWFGRGDDERQCLVHTDDDRWVVFLIDRADLDRELGLEVAGESFVDRELTRGEAAGWLNRNGKMLPASLKGISLPVEPIHGATAIEQGHETVVDVPACGSLADQILRRWPRRRLQAALVAYMEGHVSASYLDVASQVYGDDTTGGGAIEQLVIRTNESLVDMTASIYFRCGGEHVFKDVVQS